MDNCLFRDYYWCHYSCYTQDDLSLFLLHEDAIALKKKKNTLGDLILMKDIQTELEKEIEQAMLKATFQ